MPIDDPNDLDRVDQEIRINELREEARELAGGEMTTYENPDAPMPPELAEAFWQSVVDYEKAPLTTHFEQLKDDGVILPPPAELADAEVTEKLWQLIGRLAKRRVFISSTNHLSDRELYEHLWKDSLREEIPNMRISKNAMFGIDLVSTGSDEHTHLYLKYYADEETRERWRKDFPKEEIPPHETPPYDRDRHLPCAEF